MKFSFIAISAPLALAPVVISGQTARLAASPQRVAVETVHVAPKSADHADVSGRAGTVRNASDSIIIVAKGTPRRLVEFEARRRLGIGRFITDSVLRAEESRPLTMVLRAHLPGLSRALDTRPADASPFDRCTLEIYLDGFRSIGTLAGLTPRELSGVEFYTATIVPQQYHRPGSSCPVLLLWSVN